MHRNMISLSSALALLVSFAGYPAIGQAHEDEKLCNVLLDGDGDPVKEADNDTIDHGDSHSCAPKEGGDDASAAEAEAAVTPAPDAGVIPAPVVMEPLTVYFDTNRDSLSAGSDAEVQAFANQLLATDVKGIQVAGYTDTSGSAALNERLSKARATSVVAALVNAGVPSGMISQNAAGEENLAVATPDDRGEPNNRRVTITPDY